MKKYLKMLGILMGSIILGCILMICVYCIPVEKMWENTQESVEIILEEGTYPTLVKGYFYTTLDNFTDALMLNVASSKSSRSIIYKAMMIPNSYGDGSGWLEKIASNIETLKNEGNAHYQRYWHGYLVFLKPLLTVFSYQDIRVLNGFIQGILLCIVFSLLYKRLGMRYVIAFAVTVFLLNPAAISLSMQFSSVYYVTLICMTTLLIKYEWFQEKEERYELLFMGTGILVAFFDLLTYPLVSLGIPLVIFLILNDKKLKTQMIWMIKLSVAWCLGYAGMWSGKWGMCALLTRDNTFGDALGAAELRTSGNAIDAIVGNLNVLFDKSLVALGLFVFIIAITYILYNKVFNNKGMSKLNIPLACVCFYPIVWYAVLKNHSIRHAFFTYRNLTVSVFAGLCFIIKSINANKGIFDRVDDKENY